MLMECLAEGRAISLPALSIAAAKGNILHIIITEVPEL